MGGNSDHVRTLTVEEFVSEVPCWHKKYTGSPDFRVYEALEKRLSQKAIQLGYLERDDLGAIAHWGGNQHGIKQRMEKANTEAEVRLATKRAIETLDRPVDALGVLLPGVRQWGLSYATKTLRCICPERYAVLDQVLRNGMSKELVPAIGNDIASAVRGYLRFLEICADIRNRVEEPGPRPGGKWFIGDVEMALFQFIWDGGRLVSGMSESSPPNVAESSEQRRSHTVPSSSAQTPTPGRKSDRRKEFFNRVLTAVRRQDPDPKWRIIRHDPNWNWVALYRVKHDIWYGVGFTNRECLRTDLHLQHKELPLTQRLYSQIVERRQSIESALGFPLECGSPAELRTQNGRLEIRRSGSIDDVHELPEMERWAVERIIRMKTVLTPRLLELLRQYEG